MNVCSRVSHIATAGIDTVNGTFPDSFMSRCNTDLAISAVPHPLQKLVADLACASQDAWAAEGRQRMAYKDA